LARVFQRLDQLYHSDNKSGITGVPTGLIDLDQMTAGLQPGDLIIVAGRPSMGKTALALNFAEHVAMDIGMPVAVFSMEMSGMQLAARVLGSIARVDQHKMRTARLSDDEWQRLSQAMGRLHEAPLFIDETPALNALELRARARRLKRQCGKLGLLMVDYLQLMSATTHGQENRATEISEISRSLKALAKELDVPVIALSQLSRAVEQRNDRRPMMSDLRESGAIEQDADVILFIYRDEVYFPDKEEAKGRAEVIIGKQRNGPIGRVDLAFLGQFTRFENLARGANY
ncbi:MAG TPA: replicative DNA helicase, partial [Burkholderiales bacterium]|nr:replicative DNA helicase [Burkholderiales bacterium]